jgi:glycosyltransferase involved in cell wall biosynthesis
MKILYLYSEMLGYNLPILELLANRYDASVDVVHWSDKKLTPFNPADHTSNKNIKFHDRSTLSSDDITTLATTLSPDLVYVSGWMDKGYFPALRKLKANGIPTVMGLDSQWDGSVRQMLGAVAFRLLYKKQYYSHAWVPGPLQYEYAARFGFNKNEIISNLLSGNTDLFSEASAALSSQKLRQYPKIFLYVGRFADAKGVDILLEAFQIYKNEYRGQWYLHFVGNGPLKPLLETVAASDTHVVVEPFLPQTILVQRAAACGALILPSRYEPWGVVVHEFASAGMPLILSDAVGARQQFLIDGLNGYTFFNNSPADLAYKMHLLSNQSTDALLNMSTSSAQLASSVSPAIATASLMSVVARQSSASIHR